MGGIREHWQRVYETKAPTAVSWYAAHLQQSLRIIQDVTTPDARIIDVGAGASTLVDDLLDLGYRNVTVLDVSDAALAIARMRLGQRASLVTWLAADILTAPLGEDCFDLWHDRAVFHFLTQEDERKAYVQQVTRSVVDFGHVAIATFALDGPTQCSGLDVVRYDAPSLAREFGPDFALDAHFETTHTTPAEKEQHFTFCRFTKRPQSTGP